MNQEMKASDLLRNAARLVDRAMLQLDHTFTPCRCCHVPVYRNTAQARIYERLTDTPEKLRGIADKLDEAAGRKAPASGARPDESGDRTGNDAPVAAPLTKGNER